MKERFKTSLAQFPCKIGDRDYNISKIAEHAKRAGKKGASIVIFPEMSLTGYTIRDLTYEHAEEVPGPSTDRIEKIAKRERVHIISGMPERSRKGESVIYNTATLVGPEGYIGKYRKMYLPTHSVFEEKRYFRTGFKIPVFDTDIGRLGIIICYDIFFPEVARSLRLQGARFICYDIFFPEVARSLRLQGARFIICISASPAVRKQYFEILTLARALENTCYLAYVNLVGIENGLQFWGGSRLISPSGRIICQAEYDEEDIVFGNVDYRNLRPIEAFVPTLRDLRPELYASLKDLSEKL